MEAIKRVIEEHLRVASQYEAAGDTVSTARLRSVANMLAPMLEGKPKGARKLPFFAGAIEALLSLTKENNA